MIQVRPHILTLTVLAAAALSTQAQTDSIAIGGPEVLTPYADEYDTRLAGPDTDPHDRIPLDSASFIPGFSLYGEFDTEAIFERNARATRDTALLELSTSSCDHVFPVCGRLNSAFGPRHHRMHYGVDIDLELGDPVLSAFEGVVRISRFHRQFGNVVVVRHSNGLETLYGHLSERLVEVGDHLEAGELIGLGGSTGRSTGDHLHFETRYLGQPIDPQLLFDVREGELRTTTLHVHPGLFIAKAGPKTALGQGLHTVRRGDTLGSIARRHRTTVRSLCRLNRIRATARLRIGQRIRY